jgi:cytochrome c biogenesis protein
MVYTKDMKIGQEIAIPEDLGTFVLTELRHQAQFRGHPVGDAFIGRLTPPNGSPLEVILPVRFPTFDKMRRGEVVIAVDQFKERYSRVCRSTRTPAWRWSISIHPNDCWLLRDLLYVSSTAVYRGDRRGPPPG